MNYRMRLLSVTALFFVAPSQAFAEDFQPSPDGKFKQCIDHSQMIGKFQSLRHAAIAIWDRPASPETNNSVVRQFLTVEEGNLPPENRRWILWYGWDVGDRNNGASKEIVCVRRNGKGVLLYNRANNPLPPSSPFGITYPRGGFTTDPFVKRRSFTGNGQMVTAHEECMAVFRLQQRMGAKSEGCDDINYVGYSDMMKNAGRKIAFVLSVSRMGQNDPIIPGFYAGYASDKGDFSLLEVKATGIGKIYTSGISFNMGQP